MQCFELEQSQMQYFIKLVIHNSITAFFLTLRHAFKSSVKLESGSTKRRRITNAVGVRRRVIDDFQKFDDVAPLQMATAGAHGQSVERERERLQLGLAGLVLAGQNRRFR